VSIKVKNKKSKNLEKELTKKIGLFDRTPDECLTCKKAFDKKDKEMVTSWYVVVREEEKKVNLYCPSCWEKAMEIIEDFKNDLSDSI
jgi:predicted RNA-binding Zn-ribbon protein involved in translation (DUF1610 family)